jgi:hypothetical protein
MPFFDPGDTLRTAAKPRLDFAFEPDRSNFPIQQENTAGRFMK